MPDCICDACLEDMERGPVDHDEFPPEGCHCKACLMADAADACGNDEWYDYRRDYD